MGILIGCGDAGTRSPGTIEDENQTGRSSPVPDTAGYGSFPPNAAISPVSAFDPFPPLAKWLPSTHCRPSGGRHDQD